MTPSDDERLEWALEEALSLEDDARLVFVEHVSSGDRQFRERLIALIEGARDAPQYFDLLARRIAIPFEDHPLDSSVVVAHFQIVRPLGAGGMGVVYLAEDLHLRRQVALKFLPPHLAHRPGARERFLNEARLAAGLDHPNIGTIFEAGEADGRVYIAMAYVEGRSLKERLQEGPFQVDQALGITRQIALGLKAAHAQEIVHQDIKPGNVMLTPEGMVKVMDFGLAEKVDRENPTRAGSRYGTIAYMSPEQLRGEPVDHRTDIWSLGVVFYEMLTGERPNGGDYNGSGSDAIVSAETIRARCPALPDTVVAMLHSALHPEPALRLADADIVVRALQERRDNTKPSPPQPDRATKYARYVVMGLILLTLAAVLVIVRVRENSLEPVVDSLAILPTKNLTGISENDYLAEGLTDALISHFSRHPNTRVIARSSVAPYHNNPKPASTIGEELNVDYLIESTLHLSNDSLHIAARLVDTSNERVINTFLYTDPGDDIYRFQRRFTTYMFRRILGDHMFPSTDDNSSGKEIDSVTERLYLKANFFLHRAFAAESEQEDLLKAEDYFLQAATRDSLYAAAFAGLANARFQLLFTQHAGDPVEVKDAADRSLQLDPKDASAHLAQALYHNIVLLDWRRAAEEFASAFTLAPNDLIIIDEYSSFLVRTGQFESMDTLVARSIIIDPLSKRTLHMLLGSHLEMHRYDELLTTAKDMIEIDPTDAYAYHFAGKAYQGLKQYTDAEAAYDKSFALNNNQYIGPSVGCLYAEMGDRARAMNVLNSFLVDSTTSRCDRCVADIYMCLGEKDKALEWMERMVHSFPFLGYFVAPHAAEFKGNQRYRALLQKSNLDSFYPE
jgi:serine/threonine protein kinase/Tfp pilus assembly protein PilF